MNNIKLMIDGINCSSVIINPNAIDQYYDNSNSKNITSNNIQNVIEEIDNHISNIKIDIENNREYIDNKISTLIGTVPETLDTLEEISTVIQNNSDTITILNEAIGNKANKTHNHVIEDISNFPSSMPASDVYSWAKSSTKPTYTYNEVGADASGSAATALTNANAYTNTKISTHQSTHATGTVSGHVTLCDTFDTKLGYASSGMGASQYAVYNAYYSATHNPIIYDPQIVFSFTNDSGLTEAWFRRAGGTNDQGLAIVSKVNGSQIFNTLMNNDGTRNFMQAKDVAIVSFGFDNQTVKAGSYLEVSFSVTKSNYTPIGVIGYRLGYASSGGMNNSFCNMYDIYVNKSTNKVHVSVRNFNIEDDAKIKIYVDILFVTNSMV